MFDDRLTVLFDVDGTLVDSNYLHTLAWSRALRAEEEWAPMNAIHRLIGMGSDTFLPTLVGREDERIADGWRREYDRLIGEVRPFPGAAELLHALHRAGVAVVLATSSPSVHLDHMVELLGVGSIIDAVTTSDDVDRSKPDPEIFRTAAGRVHAGASHTFVVGDSTWDVVAASAARMRCIGVETGGFSRAELMDAGAVEVYRDVQALHDGLASGPMAELL